MLAEQNEKRFTAALNCLCKNISRRLLPLVPKLADSVQEIRLRLSRPLALVCPDNTYYLTQNGGLSNTILEGAMFFFKKPILSILSTTFATTPCITDRTKL